MHICFASAVAVEHEIHGPVAARPGTGEPDRLAVLRQILQGQASADDQITEDFRRLLLAHLCDDGDLVASIAELERYRQARDARADNDAVVARLGHSFPLEAETPGVEKKKQKLTWTARVGSRRGRVLA